MHASEDFASSSQLCVPSGEQHVTDMAYGVCLLTMSEGAIVLSWPAVIVSFAFVGELGRNAPLLSISVQVPLCLRFRWLPSLVYRRATARGKRVRPRTSCLLQGRRRNRRSRRKEKGEREG